ncbi:MAG: lantibiotic dehydratase family protein [Muribaculaceae bacterium]|nr:lantibiotic dehydratase family protein [Muribaculaceae bacterium]
MRFPRFPLKVLETAVQGESEFMPLMKSDEFRNALLFSSPALHEQWEKLINGEKTDVKDRNRVIVSALKYLVRMSARCTPFASLASCAVAEWGVKNSLVVSDKLQQDFRIDMLYQCQLAQYLQNKLSKVLRYRLNESVYVVGNQYRYVAVGMTKSGRTFYIKEVARTGLLSSVLKFAHDYLPFEELVSRVTNICDCNADEAEAYVSQLIQEQLLTSEIAPNVTGHDVLARLIDAASSLGCDEYAQELSSIDAVLKEFDIESSVDANLDARNRVKSFFIEKSIRVQEKYLIQLDTYREMLSATLDKNLQKQLLQGLKMLSALTPNHRHGLLENFKKRFQERYEEQEIPLLEALDPDVGVGFIVEEDRIYSRLIGGIRLPAGKSTSSISLTPITRLLLAKLHEYDLSDGSFIEFTDKDIAKLECGFNDLPLSMSAMFKLLDYDSQKREYLIGGLHFTGSSGANMLGRFAGGNAQIMKIVESVARSESTAYGDEIMAEIVHIPDSRTGNILHRPHVRDYEIAYLSNTTLDEEHRIPINDLLVSVKGGRIVLRSRKLGKEVVPRLTTAHNYSQNKLTPVYRFLCNMQQQTGRMSLNFSWQGLEQAFDHLPQVRYKNIILKPAQWNIIRKELPFKQNPLDMEFVESWRKKLELPRRVLLVSGDNKLPIDLNSSLSVQAMLSETGNLESFVLEEFIPCRHVTVDEHGQDYMNECIIPFIKVRQ